METFAKRLRKAREHARFSQAALARALELKPQAIQYLENDKNNARGSRHTNAIAQLCRVDATWLASGHGTMLPSKSQIVAQDQADYQSISSEAKQIALAWMHLSPATQEVFRELVFVHAAIEQRYPWFRRGRPRSETYDQFEQRIEQNMATLITLAAERERR
jgi:transcriptional regulator with XRE-family HTH domain